MVPADSRRITRVPRYSGFRYAAGRENNSDSPSSGERTGSSPNPRGYGRAGVVGPRHCTVSSERNGLESPAIAGESPLREAAAGIAEP